MTARFHSCLIIDDNPFDNFVNTRLIQLGNFAQEIISSESAVDALKLLREGAIKPDVIFLDIQMPEMDGFQFLDEYEKIDIDKDFTKIFLLSSYVDPFVMAKSHASKYVTKFINKALTSTILSELVN